MQTPQTTQCAECTSAEQQRQALLSRRSLLAAAAAGVFTTVIDEGTHNRYAFAATGGSTSSTPADVLVVLCLRGGFDGLSAVVPGADPLYLAARPTIAVPDGQLRPLDDRFGLHPALGNLHQFWHAGSLAVVQDVGQANPTRSHFEAMDALERSAPGSSLRTGWLDRLLGLRSSKSVFRAAQVGEGQPTGLFAGPNPDLAVRQIDTFALSGTDAKSLARTQTLYRRLYSRAPAVVAAPVLTAMAALTTTAGLKEQGYTPANGATYPTTSLGRALQDVARLLRAEVGLQVAVVDVGGWDLHAGMGTVGAGAMRDLLADLGDSLAAFATDLGPTGLATTNVVTISEFGRRVAQNGSGGTDHGHGNTVLLLGGGIRGGKVYGTWPGLDPTKLVQGDLPGSTDIRTVLAELLTRRGGVADATKVFPGWKGTPLGLTKPR